MRISIPYLSFFNDCESEQAAYSGIDVMSRDVKCGRAIFIFLHAAAVQHAIEPFSPFLFCFVGEGGGGGKRYIFLPLECVTHSLPMLLDCA